MIPHGRLAGAALLGFGLTLSGCSHTFPFPERKPDSLKNYAFTGKTLALDFSGIRETYQDKAGGHDYQMTGVRKSAESLAKGFFANERLVGAASPADYLLKLGVGFQIRTSLPNYCVTDARWEISKGGKTMAYGTSSHKETFTFMRMGGQICELAYLRAIPAALDSALNNLPR